MCSCPDRIVPAASRLSETENSPQGSYTTRKQVGGWNLYGGNTGACMGGVSRRRKQEGANKETRICIRGLIPCIFSFVPRN